MDSPLTYPTTYSLIHSATEGPAPNAITPGANFQ